MLGFYFLFLEVKGENFDNIMVFGLALLGSIVNMAIVSASAIAPIGVFDQMVVTAKMYHILDIGQNHAMNRAKLLARNSGVEIDGSGVHGNILIKVD